MLLHLHSNIMKAIIIHILNSHLFDSIDIDTFDVVSTAYEDGSY